MNSKQGYCLAVFLENDVVAGIERGDRKSTRLNSSHLVISYAVFCLKKTHDLLQAALSPFASSFWCWCPLRFAVRLLGFVILPVWPVIVSSGRLLRVLSGISSVVRGC